MRSWDRVMNVTLRSDPEGVSAGLHLRKFRLSWTSPVIDLSGLRKHRNNDEPLGTPVLLNMVANLGSQHGRDYRPQFKVEESDLPKVMEHRDGRTPGAVRLSPVTSSVLLVAHTETVVG